MNSAEMLSSLRTLLDEKVSGGFYEDADLYNALRSGELELATRLFAVYKAKTEQNKGEALPFVLTPLYNEIEQVMGAGVATIPLPNGVIGILSVQYNHSGPSPLYPVYSRDVSSVKHFSKNNYFLKSDKNKNVYYFTYTPISGYVELETPSESEDSLAHVCYIKHPSGISALVQPTLESNTHEAIIQYALWYILRKDKDYQAQEYQKFLSMVQTLYF